jgi:riboflavin kinase/FMN adenylyltransferase
MAVTDHPIERGGHVVATIGTFDGVHLGHRRLIDETRRQAAARGLRSVAVTFDRHQMTIVRPEAAPRLLTGLDHKLELLAAAGVDAVVLEFDATRAAQGAEDFVKDVLVGHLGVRALVVGSTFRFGYRHRGDARLLETMGARLGFSVTPIELVTDDGARTVISSSLIRSLVADTRLDEARRLLGRDHEVRGVVVDGAAGLVAVPAELLVPPPGDYRASWSFARTTRAGTARVRETSPDGSTVVELAPSVIDAGDGEGGRARSRAVRRDSGRAR